MHKTIVSTLPPIVGVLNGAMVLRDTSVRNMNYDQLMDVVRPKVLGSIHMDELFKNDDLEFFILFSSINCIIGNTGQANYAGANTFMASLAAQRRKRGLAATALNVGAIIGAGESILLCTVAPEVLDSTPGTRLEKLVPVLPLPPQ